MQLHIGKEDTKGSLLRGVFTNHETKAPSEAYSLQLFVHQTDKKPTEFKEDMIKPSFKRRKGIMIIRKHN